MRVLITRPREEAERLAATLAQRGVECLIEPLLEIRALDTPPLSLDDAQALAFTSANGVSAFAAVERRRDLPVFAIGERTAEVARAAGFSQVESAQGAVEELAALIRAKLDPEKGVLLHAAGSVIKGDLTVLLAPDGFTVRRTALYEAVAATALSPEIREALEADALDAVLLFSPRTAGTFVSLAKAAGLDRRCARLAVFCISQAVADAARLVIWRDIQVAARPGQSALLALLDPEGEAKAVTEKSDMQSTEEAGESPAMRAIRAFGGIRPMAAKLGVPVTTVQGWKERGSIPEARIAEVLAAAARNNLSLAEADLVAASSGQVVLPDAAEAQGPAHDASPDMGEAVPPSQPPADGRPSDENPDGEKDEQANQAPPPPVALSIPTPGSRAIAIALWAAAIAALLLAGGLSLPYWGHRVGLIPAPALPDATFTPQIDALKSQLGILEARVKATAGGADTSKMSELTAKISQIAEDLAGVKRRVATLERLGSDLANRPQAAAEADPEKLAALTKENAALRDRITTLSSDLAKSNGALQARVTTLEAQAKKANEADAGRAALVLAVGQLQEALSHPTPYDRQLSAVAALAGGDANLTAPLDALKAHAAKGVPTIAELTARYDAVSVEAARAALVPEWPGWIGQVFVRLSSIVVVRRADGDVAGTGPAAILARADARLKTGDLSGALTALAALTGGAAEAVKPWLNDARARLAADDALHALSTRAIARLGAGRP